MLIKRSKYDTIVEENLSLRKKNADLESSNQNHTRAIKLKGEGLEYLKTVVSNQLEIIEKLKAESAEMYSKLHKKGQPRVGGRFCKK